MLLWDLDPHRDKKNWDKDQILCTGTVYLKERQGRKFESEKSAHKNTCKNAQHIFKNNKKKYKYA